MKRWTLLSILLLFSVSSRSEETLQYIDRDTTLFGIEYTFQDETMVQEKGRNTGSTEYKKSKMKSMLDSYLDIFELDRSDTEKSRVYSSRLGVMIKSGYKVSMPSGETHVINQEPVTIEFNTPGQRSRDILKKAIPIYQAASSAGLVPYVQMAGERSGMGHIHTGAKSLLENPFYINPLLLRNLMVFTHKHSGYLYGFSEAFDMGKGSNIETYHSPLKQKEFARAVAEFDSWYLERVKNNESVADGLIVFLKILKRHDNHCGFFEKFRYINLTRLLPLLKDQTEERDDYTVESRHFRPYPTADHAQSMTEFLLKLYDHLSTPNYLVPFEILSANSVDRLQTATKVYADWQGIKKELQFQDDHLDEMQKEYRDKMYNSPIWHRGELSQHPETRLLPAYSTKENKGTAFELQHLGNQRVKASIANVPLDFETVTIDGTSTQIAYIDTLKLGIQPTQISSELKIHLRSSCKDTLSL